MRVRVMYWLAVVLALGDAAAMPVQSAIKKFRADFERRIKHNLVQLQKAAD